ncbi:hypothetical protein ACJJTC_016123 [Scirpophaga incertulas]
MLLQFVLICLEAFAVTSSFELGGLLTGNRMAGVPLGISLGQGEIDVEGVCTEPGFACQNCTHSVSCIHIPGGFLKIPLQKCDEDLTCNANVGECVSDHVPECQASTFDYVHTCEQVGIFPDAHDCRKFHLCSPPENAPFSRPAEHRTALCPRHYGYNPQIAQCSVKLTKGHCSSKPVPECTSVGQFGVLPLSPNHYYVCLFKKEKLYPQVFLCPHGWYFWGGFCRPEKEDDEEVDREEKEREYNETNRKTDENKTPYISSMKETVEQATTELVTRARSFFDFFSTEKSSTYAPDTFLADKFDLSNYGTIDDDSNNNDNFRITNSFEDIRDFDQFWQ